MALFGGLIQTATGLAGGAGGFPAKRSGLALKARSRVLCRAAWTLSAWPIVDLVGGHQADPDMMVVLIVPAEEIPTERPGVPDAAKVLGKLRLVFQGFEVAFRERVVVGGMRAAG